MAATTRWRIGVIGDPVAHSLSPDFQQPALDALRIPAQFERWHTPAATLPERVAGLRAPDALGACVTVPHKLAVMALLDEIAPSARAVGAVNTIVPVENRLVGENTDAAGYAAALRDVCPRPASRPALVLGAGGAARAVIAALRSLGVPAITVANRNPQRAAQLIDELGADDLTPIGMDRDDLRGRLAGTLLLVNATSIGWKAGEAPLDVRLLDALPPDAFVSDLTYRDTELLRAAAERGLATQDGLGMLVHQGALQFQMWTKQEAPLAIMWEAAIAGRAARD